MVGKGVDAIQWKGSDESHQKVAEKADLLHLVSMAVIQ
jgi:hypothetical protein